MKNGKLKGLALLGLASLLVTGCSLDGSAKAEETVVVSEDVQLESSLSDSSLEVSRQEDIEVNRNILNRGFYNWSRGQKWFSGETIYFNEKNALYSLDIKSGEEEKLASREVRDISEDKNWALSSEDKKVSLHNLQNGDVKLLGNIPEWDVRFVGNDVVHHDHATYALSRLNVETNETDVWDLSRFENFSLSFMTKDWGDLYIAAEDEKGRNGIYQLAEQGKVNEVINFAGEGDLVWDFDVLQNGSIVFQGTYGGKEGIYYWDEKTKDVQQLVSGGKDDIEGIWVPSYNLSPDESKIMFGTPVQVESDFKSNVYMAELVDGQLTNSVRIMEKADTYAVISLSGDWSEDSKTAYILTSKDDHEYIGEIAVFEVK